MFSISRSVRTGPFKHATYTITADVGIKGIQSLQRERDMVMATLENLEFEQGDDA